VVNGNHISKYISYYQFIMKDEGMKNRGVCIMHAQQTLLLVSYMRGFGMEKINLNLEHLVTMNSMTFNMISSLLELIINLRCSKLFQVTELGRNFVCNSPPFTGYTAQKIHICHAMETSQSAKKGTQSSITTRF
jgi:hypothetical protein